MGFASMFENIEERRERDTAGRTRSGKPRSPKDGPTGRRRAQTDQERIRNLETQNRALGRKLKGCEGQRITAQKERDNARSAHSQRQVVVADNMHTTELKRLLREVARLNASVQHLTRDNEHLKQKNRNLGEAERDLREQIRQARLATASRRFARGVVAAVDARRNSARIDSAYGCVPPRGIKVGEVVEFEVNAEPSKSGAPGNVINVRKCR